VTKEEPRERWFIVSTTLAYVLSLANAAGVQLECISTKRDYVGVTSCAALTKYKKVLSSMDQLCLDIDHDTYEPGARNPEA
jgi:hypothetical protein